MAMAEVGGVLYPCPVNESRNDDGPLDHGMSGYGTVKLHQDSHSTPRQNVAETPE